MSANFEYYKAFYYVARCLSFTQAASILHSSQPAITRAIHNLENELGCQLFYRSKHSVSLTPEGEILFNKHVAPACEHLFKGEEDLNAFMGLDQGTVYVGATETAMHCYLLDKLSLYHTTYPNVSIKISNTSTPRAVEHVKSGRVDFAVVTTPVNYDEPLKMTPLKSFREILVGNASFAHLTLKNWHLSELMNYPIICLSKETMTRQFFDQLYQSHHLLMQPDIELATADLVIPVLLKGLGIGFVPEEEVSHHLKTGELVKIPVYEEIPERQICIIKNIHRPLNSATREMIKLLKPSA
ncbi:MAG TPA: LysR family transcriptional regulator [Candidatus Scybalocola faecipullorum]|nr:LysR family transcriptional regulator [Candidatus Scybalocola faecipullorum]